MFIILLIKINVEDNDNKLNENVEEKNPCLFK